MRNNIRYDTEIRRIPKDTLLYHLWDKDGYGLLCDCGRSHALESRILTHINRNKLTRKEPRKGREFFCKWRPCLL